MNRGLNDDLSRILTFVTVQVYQSLVTPMTQEERWLTTYNEVKVFIEMNRRNLSKYDLEEKRLYTWMKHNRKQMNADGLAEPRLSLFRQLLELCEKYKRKNQYQ